MEFLNKEYIQKLIEASKEHLNLTYNFTDYSYSDFELINSFLIDKALKIDRANLLIVSPAKEHINQFIELSIITAALNSFIKNLASKEVYSQCGVWNIKTLEKASLKIIKEDKFILHKIEKKTNRTIRFEERNLEDYILLRNNNSHNTIKSYENYLTIFDFIKQNKTKLPYSNQAKTIVVASKNDILEHLLLCIPYQYMNKSGEVYPDTPFDPLLIVVNDFKTVKEHFIEKEIPIDTIIFIGDNKYRQSIAAISKSSRQEKFNHCIFIGTQDIETGENFEVMKWSWSLPEIKFFHQSEYQNLKSEIILHPELSAETVNFTNFIYDIEQRYDCLIDLKKLLKFIRKVYPITAIRNERRIKERANDVFELFVTEAKEVFQDEYYSIDKDYKADYEQLKDIYQNIINLIKNSNPKNTWFKTTTNIDFLVVPKSIRTFCEKEILNCFDNNSKEMKVNNLEDMARLFKEPEPSLPSIYAGLKDTQVITVSEFFKKEPDQKNHLFLSLYGNGIYPDVLLQKILVSNRKAKILCYEEEAKAMQMYLQNFQKNDDFKLRSSHRIKLCELHYPESSNINTENINEWIKYLIEFDEQKISKYTEQKFEIIFEDLAKTVERESKRVYVDNYEEHYKEICQLKKGEKVRIYRNPDIETLHDILILTDERELFTRVDYISSLWKNSLKDYYRQIEKEYGENFIKAFDTDLTSDEQKLLREPIIQIFETLQENGLSVEKYRLESWMKPTDKTKFPKKTRDVLAIVKTVGSKELNDKIQEIIALKKEYNGRLNKAGQNFSEEINNYIINKEKGKMLDWLSEKQIEEIIEKGAPMRTVKEIKKLDEEIEELSY